MGALRNRVPPEGQGCKEPLFYPGARRGGWDCPERCHRSSGEGLGGDFAIKGAALAASDSDQGVIYVPAPRGAQGVSEMLSLMNELI